MAGSNDPAMNTGLYAVPFSGMHLNGHGQHVRPDGTSFTLSTWKEDACVAAGSRYPSSTAEARRMIRAGEMRVRRLTPLECERVQGFPDNWTAVGGVSEGARYRLVGNSVMPPVVTFLGRMLD